MVDRGLSEISVGCRRRLRFGRVSSSSCFRRDSGSFPLDPSGTACPCARVDPLGKFLEVTGHVRENCGVAWPQFLAL